MSVINTTNNTVVGTILVGTDPFGVAVNPSDSRVYVTNIGNNTVSVIVEPLGSPALVGYSPQWLILTLASLLLIGGYLLRKNKLRLNS